MQNTGQHTRNRTGQDHGWTQTNRGGKGAPAGGEDRGGDGKPQAAEERGLRVTDTDQIVQMAEIGMLTRGVAHDFANLLTSINGYLSFARESLIDGKTLEQDLESCVDVVRDMITYNRELQSLCRSEEIAATDCLPGRVTQRMLPQLKMIAGRRVSLCVVVTDTATAVDLTETQMKRILLNLVTNARDALLSTVPAEVSVDISALGGAQRQVRIRVSDTGSGIDQDRLNRIFDAGYTTKKNGTGWGLHYVKSTVEKAGGIIEVQSRPGQGTTFTISLPAR